MTARVARRWAALLVVPALGLGLGLGLAGCSGGASDDDAGGGGGGSAEPDAHAAVVVAAGDLVIALQDERTSVRYALAGDFEAPGAVSYRTTSDAVDDAIATFAQALDAAEYLSDNEAQVAKEQLVIDRTLVKNDVVIVWPGEGGSYDDGGVLVGRWGPLIDPILDVQERFAGLVDQPGRTELAQLYARVVRESEDVERVRGAALANSWDWGTPAWVEGVELIYPQATDGRDGVLRLARAAEDALDDDRATTLADATDALEKSLDEQGFGTGAIELDPATNTPDPFIETLALGVWRSYGDLIRQRVIDG